MTWHVAAYSLTLGTFILIAGGLGDIYGLQERPSSGLGLVRDMQEEKHCLLPVCVGGAVGLLNAGAIGSAFAQYVWWPCVMWLYAVGCFIIAGTGVWVIPKESSDCETRPKFDWLGSVLGVVGLLLLKISWNQAPIAGWSTPYVYILLILGFVFMGLFVLQEKRVEYPLLETSILRDRHVVAVLVTTGLGWSSFGVWFYYLFRFIQRLRHVSPLDSAVQFAPGAISGIMAAIATPYLMQHGPSGWLMVIACFALD